MFSKIKSSLAGACGLFGLSCLGLMPLFMLMPMSGGEFDPVPNQHGTLYYDYEEEEEDDDVRYIRPDPRERDEYGFPTGEIDPNATPYCVDHDGNRVSCDQAVRERIRTCQSWFFLFCEDPLLKKDHSFSVPCDNNPYYGTANRICDTEPEEYFDYCYDVETDCNSPERSAVGTPVGLYVVQPGDTLWEIAKLHFGDATRWRELGTPFVGDPDHLPVGHVVSLPRAQTFADEIMARYYASW